MEGILVSGHVVATSDHPTADAEDAYVFVVYAEICCFLLVAFLYMQLISIFRINSLRGSPQPPVSLTGGKTRNFFVVLVFLANFSRALSLALQLAFKSQIHQQSLLRWVSSLCRSLPSVIFLSTYSILVFFWAQVYHAANLVSLPLLRPIFIFLNIAMYVIYFVITVLTLLMHGFEEYRTYSVFFIGTVFLIVSAATFVYGIKVAAQLSERSRQLNRKNYIIRRVLILSTVCPTIFTIRGIFCLAFSLGFIPCYYPHGVSPNLFDASIYVSSELLPSMLTLYFFWPRKSPNSTQFASVENLDASAPLIRQVYPQAAGELQQSRLRTGGDTSAYIPL